MRLYKLLESDPYRLGGPPMNENCKGCCSVSDCNCPLTGFCEARRITLKVTLQRICRENRARIDKLLLDGGLSQVVAPVAVGDHLIAAIETTTGERITCDSCLRYLTTLHATQILDCEEIIAALAVSDLIPTQLRTQCDTQQKRQDWLRPIIEAAMLEWVYTG